MASLITTSSDNKRPVRGAIFYEGPSLLDRKTPVVGIATFNPKNKKTGDLIQTWILHADQHPMEALHHRETPAICGTCPLQGSLLNYDPTEEPHTPEDRGCYVVVGQAPSAIFKGYKNNIYLPISSIPPRWFLTKGSRLGSYGDPTAIPLKAWKPFLPRGKKLSHPGYTHQWMLPRFKHWSRHLMASTHSLEENKAAHARGWRTFRTISQASDLAPDEILCPASPEGGNKATCETCGACNGRRDMQDKRKNIAIVIHGRGKEAARRISLPVLRS